MRPVRQPRGRAAIALAASEAALVTGANTCTVPAPMLVDQMNTEEWTAVLSALKAECDARAGRVTVALPAQAVPLRTYQAPPGQRDWKSQAASELVPEATTLVLSGGARSGPVWVAATRRETVLALEAACKATGIQLEAVEPAALALLRLHPAQRAGTTVVAATSRTGCEIAAAEAGLPLLARSVATRRPEDVAPEVELTIRYLEREGRSGISLVLAGPTAEAVSAELKSRGIETAAIIPAPSAAAAVATGASRRARGPDFLRELPGRRPGAAHALAALSAAAFPLVLLYTMHQLSAVASLRDRVSALQAEQQSLQAQLDRWTGPRAQAARQALLALESRRVQLGFLDRLGDLLPADLWVERVEARSGTVRIEGHSLSRDSMIRLAQQARSIWPSATLKIARRDETPISHYQFILESSASASTAPGPGGVRP